MSYETWKMTTDCHKPDVTPIAAAVADVAQE
jgi:hypothetical protein